MRVTYCVSGGSLDKLLGESPRANKKAKLFMKRGTKEFYEVKAGFEKAVMGGFCGCIHNDFTEDHFNSTTFYANGTVNDAFRSYMAGYAAAKCEYQ